MSNIFGVRLTKCTLFVVYYTPLYVLHLYFPSYNNVNIFMYKYKFCTPSIAHYTLSGYIQSKGYI